jgi:hypothetical protein
LPAAELSWKTYGALNPARDNVLVRKNRVLQTPAPMRRPRHLFRRRRSRRPSRRPILAPAGNGRGQIQDRQSVLRFLMFGEGASWARAVWAANKLVLWRQLLVRQIRSCGRGPTRLRGASNEGRRTYAIEALGLFRAFGLRRKSVQTTRKPSPALAPRRRALRLEGPLLAHAP